ncbi:MAG: hypothetical protein Q9221_006887 [Calogaya cf. arnoldii]
MSTGQDLLTDDVLRLRVNWYVSEEPSSLKKWFGIVLATFDFLWNLRGPFDFANMVFKPRAELLTDNLVALLVGKDLKAYYVHRDLICDRSAHFRAALQGRFQEAQTNRIEFPEDDEKTFELFIRRLYGSTDKGFTTYNIQDHISLLCFAQRILLTELQNDCIDGIRRHYYDKTKQATPCHMTVDAVSQIYDAVPSQTHLRFCFCLELALVVVQKIKIGTADWMMDPELAQLMQDGGVFASDFAKLLVYCMQETHHETGRTLAPCFNSTYLARGRAAKSYKVPQNASYALMIEGAAKVFDKDMFSDIVDTPSK